MTIFVEDNINKKYEFNMVLTQLFSNYFIYY